ncbi:dioxygenase superfamily protein [Planococcus antarcticus DSM 14505]|uniref:Dioxygenase superfamily protein n=1 Tax=Planococcus antarcticus DSM 14505 TaxID=1185653 RepID=A0A1C7DE61_9BACL|nr:VOC family protein [Planococcus antarcticus]ANU09734.1 glyoxalase [Planococcus antarcticus DSM 14505]EIM04928.1 dioxygenase superfamily protein [Planococcus antarcticus DSM 14505]
MSAITHVGLAVPDLEKAIDWYRKVLDFYILAGPFDFNAADENPEVMTLDLQGAELKKMRNVHLMSSSGVGIELFEFQDPTYHAEQYAPHAGFFHICLIVDDLVGTIERAVQHGGKQRSKIWNINKGKPHYLVYTEDPFGHIIELYTRSTSEIYGNR